MSIKRGCWEKTTDEKNTIEFRQTGGPGDKRITLTKPILKGYGHKWHIYNTNKEFKTKKSALKFVKLYIKKDGRMCSKSRKRY